MDATRCHQGRKKGGPYDEESKVHEALALTMTCLVPVATSPLADVIGEDFFYFVLLNLFILLGI
jgi:hypothetical protein